MAAPLINPPMPLLTPIPGGFLQGRVIRIQGSVSPSAQRFAVNLQCGPNVNPRDDLALHISPRFHERIVARNSLVSGQWGSEEHHGNFPFQAGGGFEILLLCDPSHYKVAVNGQHFTEFNFRTPLQRVTHLSADGDVMISAIYFEGQGPMQPQMPGFAPVPMPTMPPMPAMPLPVPTPGYGGSGSAPGYPSGYPSQPTGPYPPQPGYPAQPGYPTSGYPAPGYPAAGAYPGQYPPGSQPYPASSAQYPGHPPHTHSSGKGLGGILEKAGTAVAGALGATGVAGLLGGLAGPRVHASHPVGHAGVGPLGGILGGGGGGLLGTAGTAMGAAALGTALLNPKKALKQQRKAQKKAMKYGLPLAGAGIGAYALHKGMKHGFHHHGSSSSSSSSEEE